MRIVFDLFNQYNFNYDYQESSPGSGSNEVNGVGWTILGRFYWGCKWIIREQAIGPDGPYEITQCFTITDDEGNTPEFPSGVDPTDAQDFYYEGLPVLSDSSPPFGLGYFSLPDLPIGYGFGDPDVPILIQGRGCFEPLFGYTNPDNQNCPQQIPVSNPPTPTPTITPTLTITPTKTCSFLHKFIVSMWKF